MITVDDTDCPSCDHTNGSHDSTYGCLFPRCPCRITDPKNAAEEFAAAYALAQADAEDLLRGRRPGLLQWLRYLIAGPATAIIVGTLLGLTAFAIILALKMLILWGSPETPRPTSTPTGTIMPAEFPTPVQSAHQEAIR